MGKKGWWLGLALALAVAVGAPLAVFGWMDAAVLGRDTPISTQTGKLALAKYNEAKKCFEQVSEKKWSVSGSILTASNMSAGIYGVIKIG